MAAGPAPGAGNRLFHQQKAARRAASRGMLKPRRAIDKSAARRRWRKRLMRFMRAQKASESAQRLLCRTLSCALCAARILPLRITATRVPLHPARRQNAIAGSDKQPALHLLAPRRANIASHADIACRLSAHHRLMKPARFYHAPQQ